MPQKGQPSGRPTIPGHGNPPHPCRRRARRHARPPRPVGGRRSSSSRSSWAPSSSTPPRWRPSTPPDVPPTSHPIPLANVLRPDEPRPGLARDEVLAMAPEAEDGRFRVPRILAEEAVSVTGDGLGRAHGRRAGRAGPLRRGVGRRGDRRPPRAHRRARRRTPGLPPRRGRRRPGRRRRESTPPGPRGDELGPLAGVPVAVKDLFCTRGSADHRRVADPRGLAPALRRHRHHPAAGGRRRHRGQDQHGRVRHGLARPRTRLRPHGQPLGHDPGAGRLVGRQRGGGGRRFRPARPRAPTPAARSASRPPCAASSA